jgi:sulfite exporter TauE/SafE
MLWSAFIIGFIGSLHCLGMCGPIVLALPGSAAQRLRFTIERLLYNLGRAVTYSLMGAVAGVVGQGVAMAGFQQWLGIVAGGLMVLSVLLPTRAARKVLPSALYDKAFTWLKVKLGSLLSNTTHSSMLLIGVLNGFLPCGLVYMALAGSLVMGSIGGSALYMFIFGLGTLPVMFAASFASGLITGSLRTRINKVIPVAVLVMGILFILRGLSLGIPFLSPDMDMMKKKGTTTEMPQHSTTQKGGCCSE